MKRNEMENELYEIPILIEIMVWLNSSFTIYHYTISVLQIRKIYEGKFNMNSWFGKCEERLVMYYT